MAAAGRHAPPQQPARSRQHLVGAGRQLVSVDPRQLVTVVGVFLDAAAADQRDEVPPELTLARAGEDERLDADTVRSSPQCVAQERRQPRANPGRVDDQRRQPSDVARQVDELVVQRGVLGPRPGHPIDDSIERNAARPGVHSVCRGEACLARTRDVSYVDGCRVR